MKLWHRLNIDISNAVKIDVWDYLNNDPDSKQYNSMWVETPEGNGGVWSLPPHVIFHKEWCDYMLHTFGAPVATAQMFQRWPYYQHPQAHKDTYLDGAVIQEGAINWCIGEDAADHLWFADPSDDVEPVLQKRSEIDIDLSYPLEGLVELDRINIGSTPTLVHTGVLHTIEMRHTHRLSCSVRFEGIITWPQHLEHFAEAIQ